LAEDVISWPDFAAKKFRVKLACGKNRR